MDLYNRKMKKKSSTHWDRLNAAADTSEKQSTTMSNEVPSVVLTLKGANLA